MWRHPDQRLSSSRENEYHHNNMLITVVIIIIIKTLCRKIVSPRRFEITAATLLMTVNLASPSGKRYWNTASLDQSPRIFIVASGILHMSSQVAIPFMRLWVEQFSSPGHAPHRDFSRDRNFAGVKQVKAPCWFRNENRGASRGAGALVIKFRIAVTGHKTWPFMKGSTTWCVRSPCWIVLDRWIQITKPWHVNLKSFLSTAYCPQILLTHNITKNPQRSAAQINLSLRVLRFKVLCMSKRCDGSTGDLEDYFAPFPLFISLRTHWMVQLPCMGFGRPNSRWIIRTIFRYWFPEL